MTLITYLRSYGFVVEVTFNRDYQFLEMFIFKVLFVFIGLSLEVLFTDLCVRWNLRSETALNEKKKKKIT